MKALMIDDDDDIRKVGRLSLQAVGKFDAVFASSGQEGIDLARRELPDVILLDVMMPGMDGPTVLVAMRSIPELRTTPVVFLTAKVQRSEVDQYLRAGAIGVIQKPFDPMTLPDEIRRLLQARAGAKEA